MSLQKDVPSKGCLVVFVLQFMGQVWGTSEQAGNTQYQYPRAVVFPARRSHVSDVQCENLF